MLYVGSVINDTYASGIQSCKALSLVVHWSFTRLLSRFSHSFDALFDLSLWCRGPRPLNALTDPHCDFSSSIVCSRPWLVLPSRIFENQSWRTCFLSPKGSVRTPFGSSFPCRTKWRLALRHPLGHWLFAVFDGVVVGVKNILVGDEGIKHPYFSLRGRRLCRCSLFKFSITLLMNVACKRVRMNGLFEDLWGCDKNALKSGALLTLSNDYSLSVVCVKLFEDAALASPTVESHVRLLLFNRRGHLFLDDSMFLVVAQWWLGWRLFDLWLRLLCVWGAFGACCSLQFRQLCGMIRQLLQRAVLWLPHCNGILYLMNCTSSLEEVC